MITRTLAGLPIYKSDLLNPHPDMREQWFHLATVGLGGVDHLRDEAMEMRLATPEEEVAEMAALEASRAKA
jgi:hypothetical protein